MIFKVDVRFFYVMAPELTVCRISAAFSYGFLLIPAGFQKVSFYVVKGYLSEDESPCFAG